MLYNVITYRPPNPPPNRVCHVMKRSYLIVGLVALPTCVLLIVGYIAGPPRILWPTNDEPQMLTSNTQQHIERTSFRDKNLHIEHNKLLPYQFPYLVSWPTLADQLEDDFTKCQGTAPFIEAFDYLKTFKNPCWREKTYYGNVSCLPYFYLAGFSKSGTTGYKKSFPK